MEVVLAVCLVALGAAGGTSAGGSYLRATLDKIQQQRLNTYLAESTINENSTEGGDEMAYIEEEDWEGEPPREEDPLPSETPYQGAGPPLPDQSAGLHDGMGSSDHGNQGYYYYYYPLNHYLQNMATPNSQTSMKDSDVMHMAMESMIKNNMMNKPQNKVTPLFKAISWFIGTAMIFVFSILMMPRFRVKKGKELAHNYDTKILQRVFSAPGNFFARVH